MTGARIKQIKRCNRPGCEIILRNHNKSGYCYYHLQLEWAKKRKKKKEKKLTLKEEVEALKYAIDYYEKEYALISSLLKMLRSDLIIKKLQQETKKWD